LVECLMVEGPMMNVSEFARKVGVTPHTVRYYARMGLLKPQRDPRSRYKKFTESDIHRLQFILRARSLGFTLSEIGEILRRSARRETPCPMVRDIIRHRIEETTGQLDAVLALRERMKRTLAMWETMPDHVPDGNAICALIEAAGDSLDSP
jgi:MerR family transcriptional regulator, Zn(II)-responsive regulator of zntA